MDEELKVILDSLTPTQLEYISVRIYCQSDKEAAEKMGIGTQTVYNWSNKQDVKRALQLTAQATVTISATLAGELLKSLALPAVQVIADQLTHSPAHIKQRAALAVMDRTGMIPGSSVDHTSGGEPLESAVNDERRNQLTHSLFERSRKVPVGLDSESEDAMDT